jgi:hypothetical protein
MEEGERSKGKYAKWVRRGGKTDIDIQGYTVHI